ncbi:mucin-2-like [Ptychodera flava]|uniref:mucin-2-like n=1 Tax=Ptychodera flava TaxID=63121 RepID=UPI003969EE46
MKNYNNTKKVAMLMLLLVLLSAYAQENEVEIRNGGAFQWTDWMDDEEGGPIDPTSLGDFEMLSQLRQMYGFCDNVVDIECRLASSPHTAYDETGQISLTCSTSRGFMCFHSQQSDDCFNYEIRVLCAKFEGNSNTQQPEVEDQKITEEPSMTTKPTTEFNTLVKIAGATLTSPGITAKTLPMTKNTIRYERITQTGSEGKAFLATEVATDDITEWDETEELPWTPTGGETQPKLDEFQTLSKVQETENEVKSAAVEVSFGWKCVIDRFFLVMYTFSYLFFLIL